MASFTLTVSTTSQQTIYIKGSIEFWLSQNATIDGQLSPHNGGMNNTYLLVVFLYFEHYPQLRP